MVLWRLLLLLLRLFLSNMVQLLLLVLLLLLLLPLLPSSVRVPDNQQQVLHTAAATAGFASQLVSIEGSYSCPHRCSCTAGTIAAAPMPASDVQSPAVAAPAGPDRCQAPLCSCR